MIGAGIGKFLNDVCNLVETKKTTDIVDISNQSSKEGIRIVLELKKGADVENLKNMLYKKTRLEDTFGVNMLAVANGRPETLGLKAIIEHHRKGGRFVRATVWDWSRLPYDARSRWVCDTVPGHGGR